MRPGSCTAFISIVQYSSLYFIMIIMKISVPLPVKGQQKKIPTSFEGRDSLTPYVECVYNFVMLNVPFMVTAEVYSPCRVNTSPAVNDNRIDTEPDIGYKLVYNENMPTVVLLFFNVSEPSLLAPFSDVVLAIP